MEQEGHDYVEADMQDVGDHYGEDDQVGRGPYYTIPNGNGSLANLLKDGTASLSLADNDDFSPTQAYAGDLSSAAATPSKATVSLFSRKQEGKKKQVAVVEDLGSGASGEEDGDEEAENEDEDEDDFEPEVVVPKKNRDAPKRKVAIANSSKASKSAAKAGSKTLLVTRKSTSKKAKDPIPPNRKRRPPKHGIQEARPIPRCYEECDGADKILLDMRDQHKTWKEIRAVYEGIAGTVGNSTLPNRYERLKDNFSIIREEDRGRLMKAKEEVEKEMHEKKWKIIAQKVQAAGGAEYSADNLQRQYKKLMVKEGLRPPPGIVDPDFNIAISDDAPSVGAVSDGGDEDEDEEEEEDE